MLRMRSVSPSGPAGTDPSEFEVIYVAGDGVESRVPLSALAGVALERCLPVRSFPSY
jgi:hypothetical protein